MIYKLETKNEFVLGSIAGMTGSVVKYLFNELMQLINVAAYDNNATAISTVMDNLKGTLAYDLLGFTTAVLIGGFFGVILAFAYTWIFSEKNYQFKAAGFGVGIWLLNFSVMGKVFGYPKGIALSLNDIVVMLISLVIYAMVTAYVLKRMGIFIEI